MSDYFAAPIARLREEIRLARAQSPGQPPLLCLNGPLGAGKTTFTKELLASYGLDAAQVQSPTFLKLLEYDVPQLGLVLHIDAYRMEDAESFDRLALENYGEATLWLVEWPEKFLEYLGGEVARRAHLGFRDYWQLTFTTNHELTWTKQSFV